MLLTTQYLEEADALADEITVIDHGRVIAHDTPEKLKRVVGGQRLEIKPEDPTRLPEVRSLLAAIGYGEPEESGRDRLTVAVTDDSALPIAIAQLHEAGIRVTELSLHLPSLDEVFFSLTSARSTDTDTQTEDAA